MRIHWSALCLMFIMFSSCNTDSKKDIKELNAGNFNYGNWKMTGYTTIKKPMMEKKIADEMVTLNSNIIISKEFFSFDGEKMKNPVYKFLKIGKQGEDGYVDHVTSFDMGFETNRAIKQAMEFIHNREMYYEFEILSRDKLLLIYGGYFFLIEKK